MVLIIPWNLIQFYACNIAYKMIAYKVMYIVKETPLCIRHTSI